jgi:hypothetical protein
MPTAKIVNDNKGNLTWEQQKEAQLKYRAAVSGKYNSYIKEPHPVYLQAHDKPEVVIENTNNAFIILGRDRPAGLDSGYGGEGAAQAACIDIIAGLSGQLARTSVPGSDPIISVATNKNVEYDAARIYISQKTDIDQNFGLADGSVNMVENHRGKSGIGIKADCVRVMSRDGGIKLVTGLDNYGATGVKSIFIPGIDLIAGNDDRNQQPMVLGDNLANALTAMSQMQEELSDVVTDMGWALLSLVLTLQSHTHPCTAPGNPSLPSPEVNFGATLFHLPDLNNIFFKLAGWMMDNFTQVKVNALNQSADEYILSKHHTLN